MALQVAKLIGDSEQHNALTKMRELLAPNVGEGEYVYQIPMALGQTIIWIVAHINDDEPACYIYVVICCDHVLIPISQILYTCMVSVAHV